MSLYKFDALTVMAKSESRQSAMTYLYNCILHLVTVKIDLCGSGYMIVPVYIESVLHLFRGYLISRGQLYRYVDILAIFKIGFNCQNFKLVRDHFSSFCEKRIIQTKNSFEKS